MTDLIKIYTDSEGKQTVSARELHEGLKVKARFNDWILRMIEYGFTEGKDFYSFLSRSSGGRKSKEYAVTLDMAKEICMIQRSDEGKMFREYFIECEKKLNAYHNPQSVLSERDIAMISQIVSATVSATVKALDNRVSIIEDKVKEKAIVIPQTIEPKKNIEKLVNEYVHRTHEEYSTVRSRLYREFDYRYRHHSAQSARKSKMTTIAWIESIGQIEELEAVAIELFS